jgi:hypothetical protein
MMIAASATAGPQSPEREVRGEINRLVLRISGEPPRAERSALLTCLSKITHDKVTDKMGVAKFTAAAKSACASQAAAFRTAWVSYDVAMRSRRSDAEQNADLQIEDLFQNAADIYKEQTAQ